MSVEQILRQTLHEEANQFGQRPGSFAAANTRAAVLRRRRRVIIPGSLAGAAAAVTALTVTLIIGHGAGQTATNSAASPYGAPEPTWI